LPPLFEFPFGAVVTTLVIEERQDDALLLQARGIGQRLDFGELSRGEVAAADVLNSPVRDFTLQEGSE
jgi:hypothetical protein